MNIAQLLLFAIGLPYILAIFLFATGLIIRRKNESLNSQTIPLSIVVAVRNEESEIENLLKSLLNQDFPAEDFEILLVNDHSTDNTWPMAKSWAVKHSNIQLAELPDNAKGKKQAVALGVTLAKNDTIVLTDADCIHTKKWLRTISSDYQTLKADMLIGPVMISPTNTFFEKIQALEHASLTASSIGACSIGVPFMASSANLSFNKRKLGFEHRMLNPKYASGDDVFLLHSAKQKLGFKISPLRNEGALVLTKPVKSVSQFLHQRARWASKSTGYTDLAAITIGFIVLLFNLLLVILLLLSFLNIIYLNILALAYTVKTIADLLLLFPYLKQHKMLSLLYVFIPLQLIYPIYLVVAFGMAMLTKNRWKGEGKNDEYRNLIIE